MSTTTRDTSALFCKAGACQRVRGRSAARCRAVARLLQRHPGRRGCVKEHMKHQVLHVRHLQRAPSLEQRQPRRDSLCSTRHLSARVQSPCGARNAPRQLPLAPRQTAARPVWAPAKRHVSMRVRPPLPRSLRETHLVDALSLARVRRITWNAICKGGRAVSAELHARAMAQAGVSRQQRTHLHQPPAPRARACLWGQRPRPAPWYRHSTPQLVYVTRRRCNSPTHAARQLAGAQWCWRRPMSRYP